MNITRGKKISERDSNYYVKFFVQNARAIYEVKLHFSTDTNNMAVRGSYWFYNGIYIFCTYLFICLFVFPVYISSRKPFKRCFCVLLLPFCMYVSICFYSQYFSSVLVVHI